MKRGILIQIVVGQVYPQKLQVVQMAARTRKVLKGAIACIEENVRGDPVRMWHSVKELADHHDVVSNAV